MGLSLRIFYFSFLILTVVACTKGQPDIETLRTLTGFSLDQTSLAVKSKTSPKFSVTGKCHSNFTEAQVSFDGGSSWVSIDSVASSAVLTCGTDGLFRFEFLNDLNSWIQAGSAAEQGRIYFRALSDFGPSDSQELRLQIASSGQLILTGSHLTVSGGHQLVGQVGGTLTATSGSYTLKSTVKVR